MIKRWWIRSAFTALLSFVCFPCTDKLDWNNCRPTDFRLVDARMTSLSCTDDRLVIIRALQRNRSKWSRCADVFHFLFALSLRSDPADDSSLRVPGGDFGEFLYFLQLYEYINVQPIEPETVDMLFSNYLQVLHWISTKITPCCSSFSLPVCLGFYCSSVSVCTVFSLKQPFVFQYTKKPAIYFHTDEVDTATIVIHSNLNSPPFQYQDAVFRIKSILVADDDFDR